MDEFRKCEKCGETDPYPASFCMVKATGTDLAGKPCPYSREGAERMRARLAERFAASAHQ